MRTHPLSLWGAFLLAAPFVLLTADAAATTRYVAPCGNNAWIGVNVNCVGPLGPKATIQAAIDASVDGDAVHVLPGTYFETIDLKGKAIQVVGLGGAAVTTIDGNGDGPVVTCNSGEGPDTVLSGLRFTNGHTTESGGGMLNVFSSPTVTGCRFIGNVAEKNGGGVANFAASPSFDECLFQLNWAGDSDDPDGYGQGGAIYSSGGETVASECTFYNNYALVHGGAIAGFTFALITLDDCTFAGNSALASLGGIGGHLYLDHATADASLCDFDDAIAGLGGCAAASNGSALSMSACSITSTNAPIGAAMYIADSDADLFGCNIAECGGDGGGTILVDAGSLTATWCGFAENGELGQSSTGGAIRAIDAEVSLGLCTFTDNLADVIGGAIHLVATTFDAEGCSFSGNVAGDSGGAICAFDSTIVTTSCTFSTNESLGDSAPYGGGAIWFEGDGFTAFVTDCSFYGNVAEMGGGIRVQRGHLDIRDSEFDGNEASFGGGIITVVSGSADVRGCQFTDNVADTLGGALDMGGAGASVCQCVFTGNSAPSGGAAVCQFSNAERRFVNCRFNGNVASESGSVLAIVDLGATVLANCLMYQNTSPAGSGAIHKEYEWSSLAIRNCTIANNSGGGVWIGSRDTYATVANSIVWGNPNGGQFPLGMPTVRYCDVQGGAPGIGNINATPVFTGAFGGNYHLNPTSPCIDAGNNWALPFDTADVDLDDDLAELLPVDLDGNPRVADAPPANAGCAAIAAIVDLGAFEVAGAPAPAVVLADLDGDGLVGGADLAILLGAWGPCGGACCTADLTMDGVVDGADLAILLGGWH